jgi:UDP-N-acetylglucosamine 3-dehydrogenase
MKAELKPVGFAIVGPGRMGHIYARLIKESPLARLVAVSGKDELSAQALASAEGVPGYSSAELPAMLAKHPEIEAVIVATSEWAHVAPVLAALDAHKHVLVEKPMALSPEEAAEMVRRAAQAGVKLMVSHSLRFDPRFVAAHQAVASGAVGQLLHLYARRNSSPAAAKRVLGRFSLAYWLMPHDIDMMLWCVGAPVTKVMAHHFGGDKQAHPDADFIIAVLTFANGAVGVVESSWGSPLGGRLQNELFSLRGTDGIVEVASQESGVGVYHVGDGGTGVTEYPDTGYTPVIHDQLDGIFRRLFLHFIGIVRGTVAPVVSGEDGLAAVRVAAAVERSLREGREIAMDEL